MAQKLDFLIPFNDLTQYVPQNLRSEAVKGLLDNLFNRQMTHDESVPLFGYIGRKSSSNDQVQQVPQPSVERDVNAIIPVLNFSLGTERHAFTVQDLLNRAAALGISPGSLNWLYTQANNYLPPIDLDRFANFFEYFWVGNALDGVIAPSWNPELLPEYYTIARPNDSELSKLNVLVGTTGSIVRTGTGFYDQVFTVVFTSPSTFVLTATAPLGGYVTYGPGSSGTNSFTYTLSAPVSSGNVDAFEFNVTNGTNNVTLMTFNVIRDPIYDSSGTYVQNETFTAGDTFTLNTMFLSRTYSIQFSGTGAAKGKISGVQTYDQYQTIDGVQIAAGQRVLVKNNSAVENGIYIVGPQSWVRAADYAGANIVPNAQVWVQQGTVNAGRLFTSLPGNLWDAGVLTESNTTEWQEWNFWVHKSELAALGLTRNDAVQAVRPIIEYRSGIELNQFADQGVPTENTGFKFKQAKTEFNQPPLFNLYRYDGTHAGYVSSLFFYVHDLTETLDTDLQKRVLLSSNSSADFVFNHGMVHPNGELLFYKIGSELKTIWHAGYTEAEVVDQAFIGRRKGDLTEIIPTTISTPQVWTLTAIDDQTFEVSGSVTGVLSSTASIGVQYIHPELSFLITVGELPFSPGEQFVFTVGAGPTLSTVSFVGSIKGELLNIIPTENTQQQVWQLVCTSPTTFSVSGSKALELPTIVSELTVDVPYSNSEFSCLITSGTLSFNEGDTFIFRIGNLETPRYVTRRTDGELQDLYGGYDNDLAGVGAYQVPRTFVNNPYNAAADEVPEGTLYSHFRSILQNQLPGTPKNYAFGGAVKSWSEQHTLLASLLMQRDLTPSSMIDLAEREYRTALNAVSDIYRSTIAQYFTDTGVVSPDGTPEQTAKLNALIDRILEIRSADHDVRTVLFDSTSGVTGFPITLPALGILELAVPRIELNNVLRSVVMIHHDGHSSTLEIDDVNFRRSVFNNDADLKVLRSDGTETPAIGAISLTPPPVPYRGEFWIRPIEGVSETYTFDVTTDYDPDNGLSVPSTKFIGQTWFDRSLVQLKVWDGIQWVPQASFADRWKKVNLASLLNEVVLAVEERLYSNINPNARKVDFNPLMASAEFRNQLQRELFSFAALNGLTPLGSDYNAADPFTWNYKNGIITNFAALSGAAVPARWHNLLKDHQSTVAGVIPTERPDLEPWKLLGFNSLESWWVSLTPLDQQLYTPFRTYNDLSSMFGGGSARIAITSNIAIPLSGLQSLDGVQLAFGDVVLLQNQPDVTTNGFWTVQAGAWTRSPISLIRDTYVTVAEGSLRDTIWGVTESVANIGVDPVLIEQVRLWSNELWAHVQAVHPTLRLSVDTVRDRVLPPYVAGGDPQALNALTTVIPTGVAAPYAFGDGGPVESYWLNTLEFGYSLARALFRFDPLMFIGFCWGFNWVSVDGISYDGFDLNLPGHKRFRLHGDPITEVPRTASAFSVGSVLGVQPIDLTVTYNAYEVSGGVKYQNFSVRDTNTNRTIGYVREGVLSGVLSQYGIVVSGIQIEDNGIPFRIGDSFRITANADGSNLLVTFTPETKYKFLGFGQVFANALRSSSLEVSDGYAIQAYRGYDVNIGYRVGGLMNTENFDIRTENDVLSSSSYEVLFKKNTHAKNLWVQGLRISVLKIGSASTQNGVYSPTTDGSDWEFRIEGYNPRHLEIEYYNLNTAGEFQTFNILDRSITNSTWKHFTSVSNVVRTSLPLTIIGIQNVATFLFGYSQYLVDQGWEFNKTSEVNIDAETGRARTWQLEVEKFIDRCYRGIALGQGHIVNPFMDKIWVRQDTGLLSEFVDTSLFDVTGNPGVFDVLGVKFETAGLYVVRGNQESSITATAPMFSVHAQLDEYEHLLIFKNFIEQSTQTGTLYDPFSGARVVTMILNGHRQGTGTFRPEFGGHYLFGNNVQQNLQASADGISKYYDANAVFDDPKSSRHALALLGFSEKQYFTDLELSAKSEFNFWRGLIQTKGTNLSIQAFLNNNRFEDAKIDEYWAYKVAEYGDARQRVFPELRIQVNDTLQQFTQLQFDASTEILPNFTQIQKFDEDRWFALDDLNLDAHFKAEPVGTFNLSNAGIGILYTLPFVAEHLAGTGFTKLNGTSIIATSSTVNIVGYGAGTPRYNPVKLFNYVDAELVEEIPFWHPAAGQHTPVALESINVISKQNPARYNVSTHGVNNDLYDPLRPWGDNELGRIWFDTTNLAYIPYYDDIIFPSRDERLSQWGALADYATIDVYEWVKSTVPPTEYNALALKQAGDADLDSATKAAGEVALQGTYSRDRNWFIRPVAWSHAGVPLLAAHPVFGTSFDSKLYRVGDLVSLERGLFTEYGVQTGMRIGAWDANLAGPKPISESLILDGFTKEILHGSSEYPLAGITVGDFRIGLSVQTHTERVGPLLTVSVPNVAVQRTSTDGVLLKSWDTDVQMRVIEVDSGFEEVLSFGVVNGIEESQPFIAHVDGVTGMVAAGGRQLVKYFPAKQASDATGLLIPVAAKPAQGYSQATPEIPAKGAYQRVSFFAPKDPSSPTNFAKPGPGSPEIPGKAGYCELKFSSAANGNTGLPNDATGFNVLVRFNNDSLTDVNVPFTGAQAQTFNDLCGILNAALPGAPAAPVGSGIRVTSSLIAASSTVDVDGAAFYAAMPNFDSKVNVNGTDTILEVPAGTTETVYTLNLVIQGISYTVNINGSDAQTFGKLIDEINAVVGVPFGKLIAGIDDNGGLRFTSPGVGVTTEIYVGPGANTAIHALPGFFTIEDMVAGTAKVDAQPEKQSSPAVTAVPGKYYFRVTVNGVTSQLLVMGNKAQTFGALITEIQTQLPTVRVSMKDGGLLLESRVTGPTSTLALSPVVGMPSDGLDLFDSINDYDSLGPSLPGNDDVAEVIEVPGQPEIIADSTHNARVSYTAGQILEYTLNDFGLKIAVEVLTSGTYAGDAVRDAVASTFGALLTLRDAAYVQDVAGTMPTVMSNDPLDGIDGWMAWTVPTQAELDEDGRQPSSAWKPYVGDFQTLVPVTVEQIQTAVAEDNAPLTLNNGVEVRRYNTVWTEWKPLQNTVITRAQMFAGPMTITHSEPLDETNVSVYVNGIAQLRTSYEIVSTSLTIQNVQAGSILTVVIRKYEPLASELAFNPEVQDDLTIQTQFKKDYEHVAIQVRDSEGALSSTVYYFWVTKKSTIAPGKKLSTQAIADLLRTGPPNYLTFQHLIGDGSSTDPFRYDAITISDLSYIVAKDDTFKLRFTRNFTLRDDPQDLDLKDTHTEWTLIRENQRTRIPEALWLKLTDSLAGQDAAGNAIPALRRVLYDERNNGTSQFGFGPEQILAPQELLISPVLQTIVNTKLVNKNVPANPDGSYPPDFIEALNFDEQDLWFSTPERTRQTMTTIWTSAKPSQVNEIFFAALNEILASNYELTDLFKTSRLAAYSIKAVPTPQVQTMYE